MTTDPNPLQERIARALNDEGWTFEGVHEPGDYDECEDCRRTVAPIAARIAEEVAAEARKGRAAALREAAGDIVWSAETLPHMTPHDAARGLVRRAERIETED